MSKIAVVYWSGTGNTKAMAEYVGEGASSCGAQVDLIEAESFTSEMVDLYDAIAFGCPSMGCEVLEEATFEPMFSSVKSKLDGKRIALFGSYGWGDGEWMRNWNDECVEAGANMACDFVICNDAPDDAAAEECRKLGAAVCGN